MQYTVLGAPGETEISEVRIAEDKLLKCQQNKDHKGGMRACYDL